jgi:hypothetical protein
MSDDIYPSNLPGITWNIPRAVNFSTSIYEALSGAERRIRHRQAPKYRVELAYEFLREDGDWAELQTLLGFYVDRDGPFDSFLFRDQYDGVVNDVQFGTGDGVTTQFQLVRKLGNTLQAVHNPEATLAIGQVWFPTIGDDARFWPQPAGVWPDDDVEYTPLDGGWSLLPNGLVQFASAPSEGKELRWTGRYYYRARFADDTFNYNEFMRRLFETKKVALVMSLQNIL